MHGHGDETRLAHKRMTGRGQARGLADTVIRFSCVAVVNNGA